MAFGYLVSIYQSSPLCILILEVDQVAREMGSPVTEGAIVQHVDKLRKKLEEMNVVPVPPGPQRLGIPQGKVYHGQGKVYMDVKEESMVGLPLYGSRYEQEPQVSNKVNYISGGLQEARKLVPKKPSNSPKRKAAFTPRKASKRKAIETDTAQIIEISDDDDAGDMIKKEQYESADEEIDRALVIDRPNQGANGFGVDGEAETGSFEWTFESGTSSDSRNEMPQPPPTSVQRKFRRVRMMEVEEEWSEVAHGLPV